MKRRKSNVDSPTTFSFAENSAGPELSAGDETSHRPSGTTGPIDYRIARSRSELSGAFALLQRRYTESGLSQQTNQRLRVMPYHLWPQTQVFVARHQGRVIGTVSLTRDVPGCGVPMESTYADTIEQLRNNRIAFGEVCSLSVESPSGESTGNIFGQLTRLMMFHARYVGLDTLVAVVHPRHAKFYQRAMGFATIGGIKSYQKAAGQPGIPIMGKVNDRSMYRPRWQVFYFEGDFTDQQLMPNSLSAADQLYFQQFVSTDTEDHRRRRAA